MQDGNTIVADIPAQVAEVCDLIVRGMSVNKGCAAMGMSTGTFFKVLRANPEAEKQYLRARESRADWRFENLQEILDEIKSGAVDPQAGRLLIDAIKWQCGKEKAKVYGDSTIIRGDKDNPLDIGLAALLDTAGTRRTALPAIQGYAERLDDVPATTIAKPSE